MTHLIDTSRASASLRRRGVRVNERQILVTRLTGSKQELDLTEPANCKGYGRLRHFKRIRDARWPNPLPIDPAREALGLTASDELVAQVFQNAICNWRCWYCFVDFELLAGNPRRAEWMNVDELLDLYEQEPEPPRMIDLTGGQPDLTPEWVPWMMEALQRRGLAEHVYLWSDDNLSTDYFWRFLDQTQIQRIVDYPTYGRVACFKGFDRDSFSFNTLAEPKLFDLQFEIFDQLLGLGIDLYAYVTMTTPTTERLDARMKVFVDRLQAMDEYVPLRIVPLRIERFTPMEQRLDERHLDSIRYQEEALCSWNQELSKRFPGVEPLARITASRKQL